MRMVFFIAALAAGSVAITAHASPSARGELAADESQSSRTRVDLRFHPSTLEKVESSSSGPLELPTPKKLPEPRGQFVGPIWLDGVYAQHLKHLPAHMRRGMAKPIGPTMLVVDTPRIGATGAEGGIYARF